MKVGESVFGGGSAAFILIAGLAGECEVEDTVAAVPAAALRSTENLRRWRPGWWPLAALGALLPRAVRDRRSGRVPVVAA